eukprot:2975908-Rhodomonas_salina.2
MHWDVLSRFDIALRMEANTGNCDAENPTLRIPRNSVAASQRILIVQCKKRLSAAIALDSILQSTP